MNRVYARVRWNLLLLKWSWIPLLPGQIRQAADDLRRLAQTYIIENLVQPQASARRQVFWTAWGTRRFSPRGYMITKRRCCHAGAVNGENRQGPWQRGTFPIKERQQPSGPKEKSLTLRQEPELSSPGKTFWPMLWWSYPTLKIKKIRQGHRSRSAGGLGRRILRRLCRRRFTRSRLAAGLGGRPVQALLPAPGRGRSGD
jgi:hypothetical protein